MQLCGILWGSNGLCGMRSIGSYGVSTGFQGEVTELCWVAVGLSGASLGSYGALWQSVSLGPSRSSSGHRLTETTNSLGAVLTSPEGETALEICQMVKAVGQIFSGSRMTTWPRDPWKAQQLPAEISG